MSSSSHKPPASADKKNPVRFTFDDQSPQQKDFQPSPPLSQQDQQLINKQSKAQLNQMLFGLEDDDDNDHEDQESQHQEEHKQQQDDNLNKYNNNNIAPQKDIKSYSQGHIDPVSGTPHLVSFQQQLQHQQMPLYVSANSMIETPNFPTLNMAQQQVQTQQNQSQQGLTPNSRAQQQQQQQQQTPSSQASSPFPQPLRRSSLKANSKFPSLNVEKVFQLEVPRKSSGQSSSPSSSSQSCSSISEGSNEDAEDDDEEEEEDDLENSQILNLKKKISKRHLDEDIDSIMEHGAQSFKQDIKDAVEQLLKLIRAEKIASQTRKVFISTALRFPFIDLHNLLFFYAYLLKRNDHEKLNTLHQYCCSKLKDPQLSILEQYKPFDAAQDPTEENTIVLKEILAFDITAVDTVKQIIERHFLESKQNIFESSVQFGYFEEFREIYDSYDSDRTKEFILKDRMLERCLEWEDTRYVELFLEKPYLVQADFTQENYEFIKACQYDEESKLKPIVNSFLMIYFYSIEHLSPKMIRFIMNKEENFTSLKMIFKHFVLYHLNSFAKLAMTKILLKKHDYEKEIINLCLSSFNFEFLFSYYEFSRLKISGWLEDADNQRDMVKSLNRSTGINFECLLFFIRKIKLWSQKDLIHLMAKTLYERLDASNNDTNFLFTFSNPLKIIVLIIEIMQITIKNEFFHKNMCDKTIKKYSQFVQKLIKTGIDEDQMYELMVDWDVEGRKLLYIVYQNSISEIIADDKVQDVIEMLWNGNINTSFSVSSFMSVSQNILNPSLHKAAIEGDKLEYSLDKSYQSEDFIGRRSVWLNQIQFRNSIDQSLVAFASLLLLAYELQSFGIFTEGFFPVNDDPGIVSDTITKFQINLSYWILVLLFIGVNLPLNAIVNLAYLREFEKNAYFNSTQIFDLLFALVADLYIIFVYSMEAYTHDQIQLFVMIFFDILTMFCYLRLILCLTTTKAFGIILQSLVVIFVEVAKFFVSFSAILLLFAFIGYILFNQLNSGQFQTFTLGLLFLIEAMFAQFAFNDFNEQYPITGVIFMLMFLYAIAIIMMNVLVAILAFNFEKTNRQARTLHYLHIIFFVRQGNYHEKHGCMIVIPILLEFLMIPYLFLKNIFKYNSPQLIKVSKVYITAAYTPILFTILTTVLALNIILIPLAYIQRTFQLTRLLFSRAVKPISLIKWIAFGFFILLKTIFYDDMKELLKYLLAQQSQEEQAHQIQRKVTFDVTVQAIFQTACRIYVQGTVYCSLSDLFGQLRDDMQSPLGVNQRRFSETCVDVDQIVGLHLLKRLPRELSSPNSNMQFSSPNLEKLKSLRRTSTINYGQFNSNGNNQGNSYNGSNNGGMGIIKSQTKIVQPKIDRMNVKHVFQVIDGIDEETCELLYEYFEKFCFKEVARDEDSRNSVLNLHNLLKLHEHYSITDLNVAIHAQLYKIIKQN